VTSETGRTSRLWSRTALRFLSILVLLFGLLGGAYLKAHPHTPTAIPYGNVRVQTGDSRAAQLAAQVPQTAAYAAAQSAAQAKANAAAAAAAARARDAQEKARRQRAADASSRDNNRNNNTTTTYNGPVPASCQDYTGNRALGCKLMLAAGYALSEMPCLDKMWTKESNWRTTAENKSSGAYGIPQALPANKLANFGSDWRTNPEPQILWGLDYIKKRYNSPCGAWTFWQNHNWY
jgi:hypothetical protein